MITKFIAKVKGNYNQSRNFPKTEYINPNAYIQLEIFERSLQVYREKTELTIQFLGGFYDRMDELYKEKQVQYRLPPMESEIYKRLTETKQQSSLNRSSLDKQMEMNLILDSVMHQLKNYDKQISESNEKLQSISQYITDSMEQKNLIAKSLELICQIKEEQLTAL